MKTLQIARGIAGVLSLVGVTGLVGCGAETGAPEGQIGSTSEALSVASTPTDLPTSPTDLTFRDGAACRLKDTTANPTKEYFVVAGGVTSAGSVTDRIIVAEKGGTWNLQTGTGSTLSVARRGARAIQVGDDKCYIVGGFSDAAATTKSAAVDVLQLTTGSPATVKLSTTITPANMANARGGLEVSTCVDNNSKTRLVAFGGGSTKIEVSDDISKTTSWSAWDDTNAVLTYSPIDFALGKDGSNNQYVVAGGKPSLGSYSDKINVITMSNCVPTVISALDNTANHDPALLSEAVAGNVGFFEGTSAQFISTGGIKDNSGSPVLTTTGQMIVVNSWANGYVTVTQPSAAGLTTGAYRPTVVVSAASDAKHMLIGGADATQTTSSVQAVQEYDSAGGGSKTTSTLSTDAVYQAAAVFFSDASKVGAAGGIKLGTGTSTQVDELTP